MRATALLLLALIPLAACRDSDGDRDDRLATAYATGSDQLTPEELEAGRMQMDWREWIERDTAEVADSTMLRDSAGGGQPRAGGAGGAAATGGAATTGAAATSGVPSLAENWDEITPEAVNSGPVALPVHGDVEGPAVLRVQVLLDRVLFSPGIIDGRWGRNTEKAIFWLQRREGLQATGEVDERTWERLVQLAGATRELVRQYRLTADDVAGPFVTLPRKYYDRRDMDCQCYESLAEKLAERFHTSADLLRQLNPGVDLNAVSAGTTLHVPAVRDGSNVQVADSMRTGGAPAAAIARLVVSDGGRYLHALDASGRVVYHFPATLGSDYSPSPTGDYRVTRVVHDPTWHYQPALLEGVDDSEPDAVLPAGPNNAVGVVWMQLSKPHYGIHGTSAPETIGYATSNGCVRLTNWDARFLAERVAEGVPVQFRDVRG
jgi:lipoprotein-anchoring transpeptidase ErfK/SrfK